MSPWPSIRDSIFFNFTVTSRATVRLIPLGLALPPRRGGRPPPLVTLTPHPPPAVRCSGLLGGAASGYSIGMTKATEAVLADALTLDAESRARLAAEILA